MPATTNGVTGPNVPPALPSLPRIEPRRTMVYAAAPGAGRDAGIIRRQDPAEISGRINQIFSNLGAALGSDTETADERLARLTREVEAGRSFDDLRRSAGIIAQQATPPQQAPATPLEYPIEAASISPELQRILETRRIQADESLERTQADRDFQGAQATTQAALQMTDIDRWQQQTDLKNQRRLAARGVARSPMFANPAQRQVFETANRAGTEVRFGLAGTLSELDRALREAESRRSAELAEISFDEAAARSNVGQLLGVQ